ncbi:MAG: acyl-CoA thioesterase [Clostridia bacterium]|nr:acyl-CoA thioesterase [Clostridia bacterium]
MYTHKVQYYETDKMGITHHSNYIRWMEEARIDFLETHGWNYARLEESGVASPVVSVSCKYKKPTTFADTVDIDVCIKDFTDVFLTVGYKMYKGDVLVCEAESVHCFMNTQGRVIRISREQPEFAAFLESAKHAD